MKASGKFVLRLPSRLHQSLREQAQRENVSLNAICLRRLSRGEPNPANLEYLNILKPFIEERNLIGLVLFGSTARQEQTEESDIDLLIVIEKDLSISRSLYTNWDNKIDNYPESTELRKITPHFVHLPKKASNAGGLWFEVAIDGIILWEKKDLIYKTLVMLRRAVSTGEIQRKHSHGHPYWVRK